MEDVQELDMQKCNEMIQEINECQDPEKISILQAQLSNAYKSILSQFSQLRLARIDQVLSIIDEVSDTITKNYSKFEKKLALKTPAINKSYGIEMMSLGSNSDAAVPSLPQEIETPIFKEIFTKLSKADAQNLQNFHNKYVYQSQLIERKTKTARDIIWRQFLKQKQDLKQQKRSLLSEDLNELFYEYKGFRQASLQRHDELRHMKSRSYRRKAKAKARLNLIQNYNKNVLKIGSMIQEGASKGIANMVNDLKIVNGLSQDEIETDLDLIKFWKAGEDEKYRVEKLPKIKAARESVLQKMEAEVKKINNLGKSQAELETKAENDFIKQQEELLNSSNISPCNSEPPHGFEKPNKDNQLPSTIQPAPSLIEAGLPLFMQSFGTPQWFTGPPPVSLQRAPKGTYEQPSENQHSKASETANTSSSIPQGTFYVSVPSPYSQQNIKEENAANENRTSMETDVQDSDVFQDLYSSIPPNDESVISHLESLKNSH